MSYGDDASIRDGEDMSDVGTAYAASRSVASFRFRCRLSMAPVARVLHERMSPEAVGLPSELAPPMYPLKTYIVEDSPVIRENLIATLEELVPVMVVGTAEDESTASQWLAQPDHPVDLVIIDIFLSGGSGLGVLRAAKACSQAPGWSC